MMRTPLFRGFAVRGRVARVRLILTVLVAKESVPHRLPALRYLLQVRAEMPLRPAGLWLPPLTV